MGERQWGRRADDGEPGSQPRLRAAAKPAVKSASKSASKAATKAATKAAPKAVSLPLRQVPYPAMNPPSRHGLDEDFGSGESPRVLGKLIAEFIEAAEDGVALDPGGRPFTVEALRSHRRALSYVDSELGAMAVQDVRRPHVQELVTQLSTSGLAPTRVVAVVDALGSLYSYAIRRDLVDFSPIVEIQLPEWDGDRSSLGPDAAQPFATDNSRKPPPAMAQGGTWPPPSFMPPGGTWPPSPFMAVDPRTPPPFMVPNNGWGQATPGHLPAGPPQSQNGSGPASLSAMFGSPGTTGADANYDATMQERWLWWTVRIIVIVFVLIALVLVAESV